MRTPRFLPIEIPPATGLFALASVGRQRHAVTGRAATYVALINISVQVVIHKALQILMTEPHAPAKPDVWTFLWDARWRTFQGASRRYAAVSSTVMRALVSSAIPNHRGVPPLKRKTERHGLTLLHCSGRGVVACSSCKACLQFHKTS